MQEEYADFRKSEQYFHAKTTERLRATHQIMLEEYAEIPFHISRSQLQNAFYKVKTMLEE